VPVQAAADLGARTRILGPMRLRIAIAALALLAVPVAGWSAAPPRASASASAEVAGGSGCGIARGAGTRAHTVRAAGLTRTYHLTVPPGYTGRTRVPLVVDMHGAGSNAVQEMLLSRARAEAAIRGWIVATPEAGRTLWYLRAFGGADITFIRNVVTDVSRRLCIDRRRQFAMGMSNGAAMAAALTCAVPDMFAAAAAVGGFNIAGPCLERPRPILAIHGTADLPGWAAQRRGERHRPDGAVCARTAAGVVDPQPVHLGSDHHPRRAHGPPHRLRRL
jgi:polyhydroxybutyrate depolymerase